ncbi:MAG: TonB-dependent siderophore receptor [Burkholderiales bacterium]
MARYSIFKRSSLAAAAGLVAAHAVAQTSPPTASTQLDAVTVTGRAVPAATVSGWGDIPLSKTPLQASVFSSEQLRDLGAQRLSDLVGIDPAIGDAYNSEGYYDFLSVRGYVLDNRFNYRRDGLPINAETSIPLDNKARIEILKGTSGLQSGTSAPGGVVNYVVKRPLDTPLRSARLEWRQPGTVVGAIDLSQRFGTDQAFGVRLNAAAAHLDPMVRNSKGERQLAALAADWRISPDTLLEAEAEWSHRSQPSQPGFSMLGNSVPAPGDPRLSLNNQPWSLPVVFDATTASLRLQQKLGNDWKFIAHAATQRLRTDDRVAFPFGLDCNANSSFTGEFYCDRYGPNGTYDLYDFRSENERRRSDDLDLSFQGKLATGPVSHALTTGVLLTRVRNRFQQQAFNYVGTGNIEGTLFTPPDASLSDQNTNRDERSTELYVRDAVALSERLTAWLGLRHTRLDRASIRTDDTQPTSYAKSFSTPWLALSYAFAPDQLVYASWGRGVESSVAPNRDRYTNANEVFTSTSRQAEIGVKGASEAFEWALTAFDIQQPVVADFGACDVANSCTTQMDGTKHHRGLEATGAWHQGAWTLRGGTQWLKARREGSADPTINGLQPTNVPALTLKLQAGYDVGAVPGLNLQASLQREGKRMVLPDNSARISGFTTVDAALRYEKKLAGAQWTWRAGIDNLFDKRAWRESPYEFSHVYLYPLAPRTLRVSAQVDL